MVTIDLSADERNADWLHFVPGEVRSDSKATDAGTQIVFDLLAKRLDEMRARLDKKERADDPDTA